MNVNTGREPLLTLKGFNGLYSRGSYDTCPQDHLTDCMNCIFPGKDQVSIREPVTISSTFQNQNIISYFIAEVDKDSRMLFLNINGELWDGLTNQLLATVPGSDEIVALNIYGRTYISFKKEGKAFPGDFLYYYDGISLRRAAGHGPTISQKTYLTIIGQPPSGSSSTSTKTIQLTETDPAGQLPDGTFSKIYSWTPDDIVALGVQIGQQMVISGYSGASNPLNGTWNITAIYPGSPNNLIEMDASPALVSSTVFSTDPLGTGNITITIVTSPPLEVANSIDVGAHGVAYAFQYKNGYLSPPSQITYIDDPSGFPIQVSNIGIGTDNVIARVILMTKANQKELFFVPNGIINDNDPIHNSFIIENVLDNSLLESADYLIDVLPDLPSCSALRFYKGRLVIIGQDLFPDDILVSQLLIPEEFNFNNNVVHIPPEIGNNPSNTGLVIRDILYILKPNGTYATQDNGSEPSSWGITLIDSGLGAWEGNCSVFSSSFSSQDSMDISFIANSKGILIFNGTYIDPSITIKIRTLWDLIPPQYIKNIRICHDINLKRIYASLPLLPPSTLGGTFTPETNGNCYTILMADYNDGLSANTIKFSIWSSRFFTSILKLSMENFVLVQNNLNQFPIYQLSFCNASNSIFKIVSFQHGQVSSSVYFGDIDQDGTQWPINQYIITSEVSTGGFGVFTLLNLSINGYLLTNVGVYSKDRKTFRFLQGLNLLPSVIQEYQRSMNVESESIQVLIQCNQAAIGPDTSPARQGFFQLRKLDLYGKRKYLVRPILTNA